MGPVLSPQEGSLFFSSIPRLGTSLWSLSPGVPCSLSSQPVQPPLRRVSAKFDLRSGIEPSSFPVLFPGLENEALSLSSNCLQRSGIYSRGAGMVSLAQLGGFLLVGSLPCHPPPCKSRSYPPSTCKCRGGFL